MGINGKRDKNRYFALAKRVFTVFRHAWFINR